MYAVRGTSTEHGYTDGRVAMPLPTPGHSSFLDQRKQQTIGERDQSSGRRADCTSALASDIIEQHHGGCLGGGAGPTHLGVTGTGPEPAGWLP